MSAARIVPELGAHEGVPAETYHRGWDACSNSMLSVLHGSTPAHLRHSLDNPSPPTEAMLIGTAAHVAILEPDLWPSLYVRGVEGNRSTKAVKDAWAELEARHPGATILKPAVFDACTLMQGSVWGHPTARLLLQASPQRELSVVWDDAASRVVRCKARIDGTSAAAGALLDLKTTTDASRGSYERSLHNFGYHRQAAMYLSAARAVGIEAGDFVQIVVEKAPPYAVAVYRISDGAVAEGERQLARLLERYAECVREDRWPAYADGIEEISLPRWAWGQLENEGV